MTAEDREGEDRLFTDYGELVLLLEAPEHALREAIKDCSVEQLRKIATTLEDQINNTPIEGNEELFKRYLHLWMYAIRKLEQKIDEDRAFELNFEKWEHQQFY